MSIHNHKDVEEKEAHDLNATRDRFGKKHQLSDEDGRSRLPRRQAGIVRSKRVRKTAVLTLFFGAFCAFGASAEEADPNKGASPVTPTHSSQLRSTDIRVDTDGKDANSWLNEKFNKPEESFGIPIDDSTSLGFNEDGDPNIGRRF